MKDKFHLISQKGKIMKELQIGLENSASLKVDEKHTALSVGSGTLPVFATPSMIALMEKAASECVAPYLEENEATVGTLVNVTHISATPMRMTVTVAAKLVEIDGKRLVFDVTAVDEVGVIGKGKHERFIIKEDKFMKKTIAKNNEE